MKEKAPLFVAILALVLWAAPLLDAHPPSRVKLWYDHDKAELTVKVWHKVNKPKEHWIKKLAIHNGGHSMTVRYRSQGHSKGLFKRFELKVNRPDQITVTAYCSVKGSLKSTLRVAEPQQQKKTTSKSPHDAEQKTEDDAEAAEKQTAGKKQVLDGKAYYSGEFDPHKRTHHRAFYRGDRSYHDSDSDYWDDFFDYDDDSYRRILRLRHHFYKRLKRSGAHEGVNEQHRRHHRKEHPDQPLRGDPEHHRHHRQQHPERHQQHHRLNP